MDIKKIVTDYIKAENTDYAIMITGVKKYSSARVSLFGLTDVNQIRQRMLEACVTDKVTTYSRHFRLYKQSY